MLRIVLAFALLATPVAAQTLRVGQIGQQSGTLDPHRATATPDKGPASWMFDGLVRFPPGSADPGTLEPDLAERWERSADGLTWTFTLREGVQFHHGMGTLTAEDVAFSIRRAATAESSAFASDYRDLAAVEVVDPRTLMPLDEATIVASVQRTGRLVVVDEARDVCSAASHIAAVVTEAAWGVLKAAPKRVTVPDVAIPYSPPLEKALLPDPERIAAAVRATLGR